MKTKTMCVSPIKGGSAKTSTIINLAGYYAKQGKKVLTIGQDAQKNLSNFMQPENATHDKTIYDVLINGVNINNAIYESRFENIHYVADSTRLGERNTYVEPLALKRAIESLYGLYDYILIDNAPVLTSSVRSSYIASHAILLTCELEPFSLENIIDMINEITETNSEANIYIVPVKVIRNSRVHRNIKRDIENFVKQVEYIHLFDAVPYSLEMTNRIYDGEILVQHNKIFSKAHGNLKRALEQLAKELG